MVLHVWTYFWLWLSMLCRGFEGSYSLVSRTCWTNYLGDDVCNKLPHLIATDNLALQAYRLIYSAEDWQFLQQDIPAIMQWINNIVCSTDATWIWYLSISNTLKTVFADKLWYVFVSHVTNTDRSRQQINKKQRCLLYHWLSTQPLLYSLKTFITPHLGVLLYCMGCTNPH